MLLDYGEFYEISGCFLYPCNSDSIFDFMVQKEIGITIKELLYYPIKCQSFSYHKLMAGAYESFISHSLLKEEFSQNTMIRADIIFDNTVEGRLLKIFFDKKSYGWSLLLNNEKITKGEVSREFVAQLRDIYFTRVKPLFGHFGVEEAVDGVEAIYRKAAYLPVHNTFVCNDLFQRLKINHENVEIHPLGNTGVVYMQPNENERLNFYDFW